jgi:hypothetical protein
MTPDPITKAVLLALALSLLMSVIHATSPEWSRRFLPGGDDGFKRTAILVLGAIALSLLYSHLWL